MAHREKQFNGRECVELANELMEVERERDYYRAAWMGEQAHVRVMEKDLVDARKRIGQAFADGIGLSVLVFAVVVIMVLGVVMR